MTSSINSIKLPEKIIVGYCNWNQCDDTIITAVQNGVNVLIWFSINLAVDEVTKQPKITNGPDWDCVAAKLKTLREQGYEVVNLISIGGWNSPHPDTSNSAEVMFSAWDDWNRREISRPAEGFFGFDGFDWDIEGNDDLNSPYNEFTVECLDLMGRFSQLAKERGYLVSMAPAESYIDPTRASFDRSLKHEYDEWKEVIPTFPYHGLNVYSYLLSRYGKYNHHSDSIEKDTFDFITVQLYEGYSHAEYKTSIEKISTSQVLMDFAEMMYKGFELDFASDAALNYPIKDHITIKPKHLVIGLANGWAGDGKFLYIDPNEVGVAYNALDASGISPKGFAFWNILDEGKASPQAPDQPVWLAKGLNDFMHIREESKM